MSGPQGSESLTSRRRAAPLGHTSKNRDEGSSILTIVAVAHIVLGAIGLLTAGVALLFLMEQLTFRALLLPGLLFLLAVFTILAGLWLRDGKRKGAVIAAAIDLTRLALLLLIYRGIDVEAMLAAALLVGVVWVWPTLD